MEPSPGNFCEQGSMLLPCIVSNDCTTQCLPNKAAKLEFQLWFLLKTLFLHYHKIETLRNCLSLTHIHTFTFAPMKGAITAALQRMFSLSRVSQGQQVQESWMLGHQPLELGSWVIICLWEAIVRLFPIHSIYTPLLFCHGNDAHWWANPPQSHARPYTSASHIKMLRFKSQLCFLAQLHANAQPGGSSSGDLIIWVPATHLGDSSHVSCFWPWHLLPALVTVGMWRVKQQMEALSLSISPSLFHMNE